MAALVAFTVCGIPFLFGMPAVFGFVAAILVAFVAIRYGDRFYAGPQRFLSSRWRYLPVEVLVAAGLWGWCTLWFGPLSGWFFFVYPTTMLAVSFRVMPGLLHQSALERENMAQASRLRESRSRSLPPKE
jgi:hypothetical protein